MTRARWARPASARDVESATVVRRFHAVTFVVGLGGGMTTPFIPVLASDLGASSTVAGLAVGAVGISLFVVDLFGSRFVPRLDPSRAIAFGTTMFALGSLTSAVAPSPSVIVLARLVQGVGAAFFMGASLQVAARLARPDGVGTAIGAYNAAWFAGISTGPFLGGAVTLLAGGTAGIRLAFGVCAAVNVLSAVAAWRWISVAPSAPRPILGWPRRPGFHHRRAPAVLVIATGCQGLRGGLAQTLVPWFAAKELGLGGLGVALVAAVLAVTDVASMRASSSAADRFGRTHTLAAMLGVGAAGALVVYLAPDLGGLVVACGLMGLAIGAAWVLPAVMVVDVVDDATVGLASFRIVSDVGLATGGIGAGVLVGRARGAASFGWAAAGLVVLAGLTLATGETARRRRPETTRARPGLDGVPPPAGAAPGDRRDSAQPHPHPEPVVSPPPASVPGGDTVSEPAVDLIAAMAAHQGVASYLSADRLAHARAVHASLRPKLEAMRAVPLSFLEPVIEPATSLAWLERGGEELSA
jgi:predicted MFS family arabinose efflux permease